MTPSTVTYQGSCHCQAIRFEIVDHPITKAIRCNCSICRRKNAIMSEGYYPPGRFTLLEGEQHLATYQFEPKMVNHVFCGQCGIHVYHSPVQNPEVGCRVNLCCIEGIDAHDLPIRLFDGRDTWQFLD